MSKHNDDPYHTKIALVIIVISSVIIYFLP